MSGLIITGVARYNHLGDYFVGTAVDRIIRGHHSRSGRQTASAIRLQHDCGGN